MPAHSRTAASLSVCDNAYTACSLIDESSLRGERRDRSRGGRLRTGGRPNVTVLAFSSSNIIKYPLVFVSCLPLSEPETICRGPQSHRLIGCSRQ